MRRMRVDRVRPGVGMLLQLGRGQIDAEQRLLVGAQALGEGGLGLDLLAVGDRVADEARQRARTVVLEGSDRALDDALLLGRERRRQLMFDAERRPAGARSDAR